MAWRKIKNRIGRAATAGVSVALSLTANGQIVILNFAADVLAAAPWLAPGGKVSVELGVGPQQGWLRVAPDPAGRTLSEIKTGDPSRAKLQLMVWEIDFDGRLERTPCEFQFEAGGNKPGDGGAALLVALPAPLHPRVRATVETKVS